MKVFSHLPTLIFFRKMDKLHKKSELQKQSFISNSLTFLFLNCICLSAGTRDELIKHFGFVSKPNSFRYVAKAHVLFGGLVNSYGDTRMAWWGKAEQVAQRATIARLTPRHQNILNSYQVKIFFNWSRVASFVVHGWIRPNFKLIRDYRVVHVDCKKEEDPIKNEGARVLTSL